MGLGGSETRLEPEGYSKLGEADRIPRMKEEMEGIMEEEDE